MPFTVLIADDHDLTVRGTRDAIGAIFGFEVVATVRNGIEAIAEIRKLRPDCAVLDFSMPGANGLEVLIEARRWSPATRIVIVTGNASPSAMSMLMDAGVDGIFLKTAPVEEFCDGLRRIANGARIFAADVDDAPAARRGDELSAREIEVLHGIARGLTNAGIGEQLGVSAKTVDTHRTSMMRKLGVHSTATLLVRAMREGLVDI